MRFVRIGKRPDRTPEEARQKLAEARNKLKERRLRYWTRLRSWIVVIPYLVGIAWHCVHPYASVFTGDFERPRKFYIDESTLEPGYFRTVAREWGKEAGSVSLKAMNPCQVTDSWNFDGVSCQKVQENLAVVSVDNLAVSMLQQQESLLLVFHSSSGSIPLVLARRLVKASWLSKTVHIAITEGVELQTVLDHIAHHQMVRQVVVVETTLEDSQAEVLPQGRYGVLPNMDLTWLAAFCMQRHMKPQPTVHLHPYSDSMEQVHEDVLAPALDRLNNTNVSDSVLSFAEKVSPLLGFEYSLLAQPQLHADALDRGIDSLTIRGGKTVGPPIENIVRGLSNLHERLHHSTSLYVIPNSQAFVKHEEYLVPNLLLFIPGLLRLIDIVFMSTSRLHLRDSFASVGLMFLLASVLAQAPEQNYATDCFALWTIVVFSFLGYLSLRRDSGQETASRYTSVQFGACLLLVLVHVTTAFGNVSLSFPSAMWWTPWIVWQPGKSFLLRFIKAALTVAVLLPSATVVLRLLLNGENTLYFEYGFLPLYVASLMLYLHS